jgi:single-stranded DNA-binding protein
MPIKTSTSVSGFAASAPVLTRAENGDARLFVKLGQEHYIRNPDGSFTQGETTFHDLVMFRRAAERAAAKIEKMDWLVAEGYLHTYTVTGAEGQMSEREEFVARRIGHDNARTNYTIERRPRQAAAEGGAANSPAQSVDRADGRTMISRGPASRVQMEHPQSSTQPRPAAMGM